MFRVSFESNAHVEILICLHRCSYLSGHFCCEWDCDLIELKAACVLLFRLPAMGPWKCCLTSTKPSFLFYKMERDASFIRTAKVIG